MKITMIGGALLAIACASGVRADDEPPAPKGNFMSSLKQSFRHDYDHEVVRGHFDVGTAPNAHRYYCLIDPKTGKLEENGIAGKPTKRRDGLTVVQDAAVSFYSCVDAESQGMLVTSDYQQPDVKVRPVTVKQKTAPAAAAAATPAAAAAPVSAAIPGTASDDRSSRFNTSDPLFTLQSFIAIYNAGDAAALASLLADSADFVWVQADGRALWGHPAAADAVRSARAAGLQLQFQSQDGHTISVGSKTAILVTRLRLIGTGEDARALRCSSVIVPTPNGWRIVSLFMTPDVG